MQTFREKGIIQKDLKSFRSSGGRATGRNFGVGPEGKKKSGELSRVNQRLEASICDYLGGIRKGAPGTIGTQYSLF